MKSHKNISQRKYMLILLLVGLMTVAYSSIGIYTPAMPAIGQYFGVSNAEVQFTFSIYIISFAFGQLIYGPISDKFGRRPALIIGMIIYIFGCLLAVFSFSISMLIIARAVQAFGGCVGPVVGRAIIRDLYDNDQGARVLSYVAMVMGAAPAFAPVIGGYLQVNFNWQSIFILLFIVALIFLLLNLIYMDETNKNKQIKPLSLIKALYDYLQFLSSPLFLGYTLVASFAMSAIFIYSSGAPFILINLLGVSPDSYGWYVLIPTLFNIVGALFASKSIVYFGGEKLIFIGALSTLFGGILMVIYINIFSISVTSIILPMCLIMFGIALLYPSAAQSAVGLFDGKIGSASSLNSFLHMFIAAFMVLISGYFFGENERMMIFFILINCIMTFLCVFIIYLGRKNSA